MPIPRQPNSAPGDTDLTCHLRSTGHEQRRCGDPHSRAAACRADSPVPVQRSSKRGPQSAWPHPVPAGAPHPWARSAVRGWRHGPRCQCRVRARRRGLRGPGTREEGRTPRARAHGGRACWRKVTARAAVRRGGRRGGAGRSPTHGWPPSALRPCAPSALRPSASRPFNPPPSALRPFAPRPSALRPSASRRSAPRPSALRPSAPAPFCPAPLRPAPRTPRHPWRALPRGWRADARAWAGPTAPGPELSPSALRPEPHAFHPCAPDPMTPQPPPCSFPHWRLGAPLQQVHLISSLGNPFFILCTFMDDARVWRPPCHQPGCLEYMYSYLSILLSKYLSIYLPSMLQLATLHLSNAFSPSFLCCFETPWCLFTVDLPCPGPLWQKVSLWERARTVAGSG